MKLETIKRAVKNGSLNAESTWFTYSIGVHDGTQFNYCKREEHDILNKEGEKLFRVEELTAHNSDYSSHSIYDYKNRYYVC